MDIKSILRNVKNKGLRETYQIYKERKQSAVISAQAEVIIINGLKEMLKELAELAPSEDAVKLMKRGIEAKTAVELRTVLKEMDELNIKGYGKALKKKYFKEILPKVYSSLCQLPVKNKAVFLQPRKGLNQSCKYIYNKLKREKQYEVHLYELHRGEVGVSEFYANAEKFIYGMATAKAVFVHESNNLMGHLNIRNETKVIQLWHGCGVFKKIGLSTIGKKDFKSAAAYAEYPEYNNYDCVTIASPELSWVFEEFMGISKDENIIRPIGVSRTDEFFDEDYRKKCYEKLYEKIPAARDKKVILYAPTYRGVDPNRVSPDELDVEKFAKALSDDYILIFKHHQTAIDLPEIPEPYKDTFAYDMTRGKGMSINDLMTVADICISDYSSLVFEYSLFERPMIFFAYDLEDYIDERGLYYDFDEITPGPVVKTNEEMIDYIQNIDQRFDKQEVLDFKNKFMCSCDGHATERIIALIEE